MYVHKYVYIYMTGEGVAEDALAGAQLAPAVHHIHVHLALVLAAVQRARGVCDAKDGLLCAAAGPANAALHVHHARPAVGPAEAEQGPAPESVRAAAPALLGGAVAKLAERPDEVDVVGVLVLRTRRAAARVWRAVARVLPAALLHAHFEGCARAPQRALQEEKHP
jgi:hypothetical protein